MSSTSANVLIGFAASVSGAALAAAAMCRKSRSYAKWCFAGGMTLLAVESALLALALQRASVEGAVRWHEAALAVRFISPAVWLAFSLSYARGNSGEFLARWRPLLLGFLLLPAVAIVLSGGNLLEPSGPAPSNGSLVLAYSAVGKMLNLLSLVGIVLVLTNFERTFGAAVGVMRWRLKLVLLGLALVFGTRLYTGSQALLFGLHDPRLVDLENGAIVVGALLIAVGYLRQGLVEAEVYPSHAFIEKSLTMALAGVYLFLVGVLAQFTKWIGGSNSFYLQALLILVGIAALGVILLSERVRQHIRSLVSRHFRRPQHDFREVWTRLTEKLTGAVTLTAFASTAVNVLGETFNALSTTIWMVDDQGRLSVGASTVSRSSTNQGESVGTINADDIQALIRSGLPVSLEHASAPWGATLRALSPPQLRESDNRIAVPLVAGTRLLAIAVLADRVYRMPYTVEELDLAKCMGDQLAAGLMNLQLSSELVTAKEFETFQAMSAFFVHDLKNSASSLNLMLNNLPIHFDNPEFRADALRDLGSAAGRLNELISRLSTMRSTLDLQFGEADLNRLILDALAEVPIPATCELSQSLALTRSIAVDASQMRSVVTNLILNAVDATEGRGRISVATAEEEGKAVLSVADNGCGMSPEFVCRSLFRPFQTTKKKGIGIGMFQTRMIVEAHHGRIHVDSEAGSGTTFRVVLPISST